MVVRKKVKKKKLTRPDPRLKPWDKEKGSKEVVEPRPDVDEFRHYLQIDLASLDEALKNQAQLFHNISDMARLAQSRRDKYYEAVKQIDAYLNLQIRKDAEISGDKVTESMVNNMVQAHPDHEEAYDFYLNAKDYCDQWMILKDSFIQRSYMLRELTALYIAGYYSEKVVKGDNKNSRDFRSDINRRRITETRKKLRKGK